MKINKITLIAFLFIITGLSSCDGDIINPKDEPEEENCPLWTYDLILESGSGSPIWHPDGKFIGFNHMPLDSILYLFGENCLAAQVFNHDFLGFWLINADGTDKRRILPYGFLTPAWSPDGKWIAFSSGGQICKMPFDVFTEQFDTTQIIQLTHEGSNFFPSWSPDGQWISYANSNCGSNNEKSCGIWIMNISGDEKRFISKYGMYPTWHPLESIIIYERRYIVEGGVTIGDSLFEYDININQEKITTVLTETNRSNSYFRFSLDGTQIAFVSQAKDSGPKLWIMNADGSELRQLSHKERGIQDQDGGILDNISWSPDGFEIIFTHHNYHDWNTETGTLWIIDVNTGKERQLTYHNLKGGY